MLEGESLALALSKVGRGEGYCWWKGAEWWWIHFMALHQRYLRLLSLVNTNEDEGIGRTLRYCFMARVSYFVPLLSSSISSSDGRPPSLLRSSPAPIPPCP